MNSIGFNNWFIFERIWFIFYIKYYKKMIYKNKGEF